MWPLRGALQRDAGSRLHALQLPEALRARPTRASHSLPRAPCCSAGPSTEDLSTVGYTYTSSVDLVGHPNAGLIGVLMVGAPGAFDT